MTTSKGPWIYDAESGLVLTKDTTGDWTLGTLEDVGIPPSFTVVCMPEMLDGISNGHLLAAAPEMRDALRGLLDMHMAPYDAPEYAAARAALAKAER